jgi:hypothetical protein
MATNMKSYWWQCASCSYKPDDFKTISGSSGIAHYIRDVLIPSDWDQKKLVLDCPKCQTKTLYIHYYFDRKNDPDILRVTHIVGLGNNEYLPMMWETLFKPYDGEAYFDFKYMNGRNAWCLNKAAVFSRNDLSKIFKLYCEKININHFP